MAIDGNERQIERSSARLRRLVTVLLAGLWVLLLLERFGWAAVAAFQRVPGTGAELMQRLSFQAVAACPEVLYLLALEGVRHALGAFAGGDLYGPVISRMLRRVGAMLAAGAFLNVFVVPGVDRALGMGRGYWIAFDVTGLVLGTIGLSLAIMARVLERAREQKAELDEIF